MHANDLLRTFTFPSFVTVQRKLTYKYTSDHKSTLLSQYSRDHMAYNSPLLSCFLNMIQIRFP